MASARGHSLRIRDERQHALLNVPEVDIGRQQRRLQEHGGRRMSRVV
jgi:hypothetical protein